MANSGARQQRKFLFPVRAACRIIPRQVVAGLASDADAEEFAPARFGTPDTANRTRWFSLLYSKHWVLYAKRSLVADRSRSLSYLGHYTHRVALSKPPYPRAMRSIRPSPSPIATTGMAALCAKI